MVHFYEFHTNLVIDRHLRLQVASDERLGDLLVVKAADAAPQYQHPFLDEGLKLAEAAVSGSLKFLVDAQGDG